MRRSNLFQILPILTLAAALLAAPVLVQANTDTRAETYIYFSELSQLRHLAEQGDPAAIFELGNFYYTGRQKSGIAQNYRKAFKLFMRAAKLGHAASQHNVAVLYLRGQGVKQNERRAAAWFMVAAESGSRTAMKVVKRLHHTLQAPQLAAIRRVKNKLKAGFKKNSRLEHRLAK